MNQTKKAYSAPKLTIHGNVEEITKASKAVLTKLDANYPTGTPFNQLTFS